MFVVVVTVIDADDAVAVVDADDAITVGLLLLVVGRLINESGFVSLNCVI